VDGHELVGSLDHGVVGEHAPGRRAGSHGHDPPRFEHLVVDPADDRRHLDRHPAGEDQEIRLPRCRPEGLGPETGDVIARGHQRDLFDRAARQTEGHGEDRVRPAPIEDVLESGGEQPLLDVLLEVPGLQVPAQEIAGAQLTRSEALPLYFQSSAPRRQTNTRATSNSTTKTRISPSTKTLLVAWTRTPTG